MISTSYSGSRPWLTSGPTSLSATLTPSAPIPGAGSRSRPSRWPTWSWEPVGIDTASYSFPYVAHWADNKPETVREVGARVLDAAQAITAELPLVEPAVPEKIA